MNLSFYPFIHSFIHWFTNSPIHSSTHSSIHLSLCQYIILPIPSIYPIIHLFLCSLFNALIIHYLFIPILIDWFFINSFPFLQNSFPLFLSSFYATSTDEYSKYLVNKITKHGGIDVLGGRNISLDRYFPSMSVADWILERNITVTGTMRRWSWRDPAWDEIVSRKSTQVNNVKAECVVFYHIKTLYR